MLAVLLLLFTAPLLVLSQRLVDCSRNGYDRCIRIADPLIKEPHLVFPDNLNDIDLVCRTWNQFVDCLKIYTDNCFTEQQRRQFNKAVENPIESVHQMCMQPSYQQEYLQYASCIKSTITERNHCGIQYNQLVDQVSQGDITSKSTLCCSHDRFKQCVIRETKHLCDNGVPDGAAARFSIQTIDKALSFLQDQCYNYIPNSGDCLTLTTDSDPLTYSSSSSEVYPWSTIQDGAARDVSGAPKMATATSWLPSSSLPIQTSEPVGGSTPILGSRTRPASYGRSSSWPDTSDRSRDAPSMPPSGGTAQMFPDMPTTQSSRPDWMTTSWPAIRQNEPSLGAGVGGGGRGGGGGINENDRGITWYPAAGDQLGNEVDEPNQQGWTKPKNTGSVMATVGILTVLLGLACNWLLV